MTKTKLPLDANGEEMPVLSFKKDGGTVVNIAAGSTVSGTDFDDNTQVITIIPTINCFFNLGVDSGASADTTTSHYWLANMPLDIDLGGSGKTRFKRIAVISADGVSTGKLYISERV